MVDATKYGESDFLTVELVHKLPTKQGVIIGVEEKDTPYGRKLVARFGFGERIKEWTLPIGAVNLFMQAWGTDTSSWLEKKVFFMTEKNKLLPQPIIESKVREERV